MFAGDYLGVEERRGRFELWLPRAALWPFASADCAEVRATSSVMSSGTEEEEGPATTATKNRDGGRVCQSSAAERWESYGKNGRAEGERSKGKKKRAVRQIHAAVFLQGFRFSSSKDAPFYLSS